MLCGPWRWPGPGLSALFTAGTGGTGERAACGRAALPAVAAGALVGRRRSRDRWWCVRSAPPGRPRPGLWTSCPGEPESAPILTTAHAPSPSAPSYPAAAPPVRAQPSQPAAPGAPGVGALLAQPRGPIVKRRPPAGSTRPMPTPVRPAPAAPRDSAAAQPPGSHGRRGWRGWERARPAGNGGTERGEWHGAGLCSRPRPAWGCPGAPAEKRASRLLVGKAVRASSDAPGRPCRPPRSWPAPPPSGETWET